MNDQERVAVYEPCDDCGVVTIRAKWTMDGSETLADAAAALRDLADDLEALRRNGFELIEPVNDDYGFLARMGTALS